MTQVISVMPDQEGWMVQSPPFENAQLFRSGARAEAAAMALGQRYVRAGQSCEIRIFLRDGRLAGRFVCPAPSAEQRLAEAS